MSYLHCHKCGWSQDDFWDWYINWKHIFRWKYRPFGYNPLSLMLEYIALYWKPRYIGMDSYWCRENGLSGNTVHSWWLLKYEFKHLFRRIKRMKYWSYKSYSKAVSNGTAKCPKCGCKTEFDID